MVQAVAAVPASGQALALADGFLKGLFMSKLKSLTVVILLLSLTAGAGVFFQRALAGRSDALSESSIDPQADKPGAAAEPVTATLRQKVKTIVVIYAENRAFDALYSNFPGANGLSSVVDSLLDTVASIINLLAVRQAMMPADREHRFGHGKAEPLAKSGAKIAHTPAELAGVDVLFSMVSTGNDLVEVFFGDGSAGATPPLMTAGQGPIPGGSATIGRQPPATPRLGHRSSVLSR